MESSKAIHEVIKKFEGFSTTPYLCQAGHSTIGYGHLNREKFTKITKEEADELFVRDVSVFDKGVANLLGDTSVTQSQFDALVSFAFNLGLGALGKSSLLKYVKQDNISKAAKEFPMWGNVRIDGKLVPSKGLKIRRTIEQYIFMGKSLSDLVEAYKDNDPFVTKNSLEIYQQYMRDL